MSLINLKQDFENNILSIVFYASPPVSPSSDIFSNFWNDLMFSSQVDLYTWTPSPATRYVPANTRQRPKVFLIPPWIKHQEYQQVKTGQVAAVQ